MAYEYHPFTIRDGKITLYKRNLNNNAVWQCRFMAKGKCIRRSTKETSVEAAKAAAAEIYDETRFKVKHDLPITKATFETIWRKWIVVMQSTTPTWRTGGHRLKYATTTANAHFLPYFGKKPITAITTAAVTEYWTWRMGNGKGGNVAAATISMEAQLLRQFLKWAVDASHIAKMPAIKSPLKVEPGKNRREAFTPEEYSQLKGFMIGWAAHPKPDIKKRRRMFRNFVMVMFESGMRQNEARNLKWQDVDIDGQHVLLFVTGKTGSRTFVAQPTCKPYLKDQFEATDFKKPTDYVFANPKGGATSNFENTFKSLLREADMLTGKDGTDRVIYSMRHSYCTWRILDGGVNVDKLADNMGTSVAMIKQHYGHVTNEMFAAELTANARRKRPAMLTFPINKD